MRVNVHGSFLLRMNRTRTLLDIAANSMLRGGHVNFEKGAATYSVRSHVIQRWIAWDGSQSSFGFYGKVQRGIGRNGRSQKVRSRRAVELTAPLSKGDGRGRSSQRRGT